MAKKEKAPGRLTISRLTVRGVLGIEESTIDLDEITILSGSNASSKSSHLAAIRSALGIDRTSLARLSRVGSEDAPFVEVLLVGDDRELHVSRKGDNSPEVRERVGDDWRKVPRPVEFLRDLIDVQGANPAHFLAMKDEERAAAILEAMPLPNYSREEALEAAGLHDFRLPAIPSHLHPLEDLEQVEKAVFDSRTEVNRQERAEHDAATKLLAGLPAEPPKDIAAAVQEQQKLVDNLAAEIAREEEAGDSALRQAEEAANATFAASEAEIHSSFKTSAAKLRGEHEKKAAEIRAKAEREVAEDLAVTNAAIDALREAGEVAIGEFETLQTGALDTARQERQNARERTEERQESVVGMRERLAELRTMHQSIETDRHVRATAQEAKTKAEQHAARANELTRGLEALKRYKLMLASALPIKGLAVHFDERGRKSLTLEGVPLEQVNRGRQAEIAVEVSLLRGARPSDDRPYLPLVLLDDAEKLDAEARNALLREVAARGSQVVAAVVGTTPLQVLRGEEAVTA